MEPVSLRSDEERAAHCRAQGIIPEQHCCLDMAWWISEPVEWPGQGPNPVMLWLEAWDEYRINIPRGGNAAVVVRFCPWCGQELPPTKEELWHQALYDLGFFDPTEQDIPEELKSDLWWRTRGL